MPSRRVPPTPEETAAYEQLLRDRDRIQRDDRIREMFAPKPWPVPPIEILPPPSRPISSQELDTFITEAIADHPGPGPVRIKRINRAVMARAKSANLTGASWIVVKAAQRRLIKLKRGRPLKEK